MVVQSQPENSKQIVGNSIFVQSSKIIFSDTVKKRYKFQHSATKMKSIACAYAFLAIKSFPHLRPGRLSFFFMKTILLTPNYRLSKQDFLLCSEKKISCVVNHLKKNQLKNLSDFSDVIDQYNKVLFHFSDLVDHNFKLR